MPECGEPHLQSIPLCWRNDSFGRCICLCGYENAVRGIFVRDNPFSRQNHFARIILIMTISRTRAILHLQTRMQTLSALPPGANIKIIIIAQRITVITSASKASDRRTRRTSASLRKKTKYPLNARFGRTNHSTLRTDWIGSLCAAFANATKTPPAE